MFLDKYIKNRYTSTLFRRYDDDGTIFYFSEKDFPGLRKNPYTVKNQNGERLQGYFYSYDGADENQFVIFDHGMGNGHRAYMREIEMLASHGYTVFAYDHTGCTESEGKSIMGFAGSVSDLDHVVKALLRDEKHKNKKISVVGHSWGAFSTMNIAALNPEISNVVAMSGFVSVSDMQKQVVPKFLSFSQKSLYDLEREATPDYYHLNAIDSLRHANVNALIIHSVDDKTVSVKNHFYKLRNALSDKENVRFLLVSSKGHNPNYTEDAVKYKKCFFKQYSKNRKKGELSSEKAKAEFKDRFDWYRMTAQDPRIWEEIFRTLEL